MAIKNPSFEDGDGIPTDWTLTTAGTDSYAEFNSFGGGIESFCIGWPGENDVAGWEYLPTSPIPAEFDNSVHPYETWDLQWIEIWAHAAGLAAYFNAGTETFDDFEWTTWYTTVPSPVVAMFDAGTVPRENFEGIWWATLPAPVAAQFDDKWGGGGAPQVYESFEP